MNTKDLTKMSICVALLCVSAYIAFPLPFTPALVTAQTIMINLIALILKPKQSLITIIVYILLGIVGLPVFSGGTAGIGRLIGPYGGFFIGFIVAVPLISFLKGKNNSVKRFLLVTILVGMPIIYVFGAVQLSIINKISFVSALSGAVIPFIFGDVVKCIAASYIALTLNKVLSKNNLSA